MAAKKKIVEVEQPIEQIEEIKTVTVNAVKLNVRKVADINSEIVAVVDSGNILEVIGDTINGFVPIKYSNITGFVAAEFVS